MYKAKDPGRVQKTVKYVGSTLRQTESCSISGVIRVLLTMCWKNMTEFVRKKRV